MLSFWQGLTKFPRLAWTLRSPSVSAFQGAVPPPLARWFPLRLIIIIETTSGSLWSHCQFTTKIPHTDYSSHVSVVHLFPFYLHDIREDLGWPVIDFLNGIFYIVPPSSRVYGKVERYLQSREPQVFFLGVHTALSPHAGDVCQRQGWGRNGFWNCGPFEVVQRKAWEKLSLCGLW